MTGSVYNICFVTPNDYEIYRAVNGLEFQSEASIVFDNSILLNLFVCF